MFIKLDLERPTPIFSQIMEGIRLSVVSGRSKAGDKIPSIRDLAIELRVNPNTVAKAYQELEREGILEVKRGMGTFIAENQNVKRDVSELLQQRIEELLSIAVEMGFSPTEVQSLLEKSIAKNTPKGKKGK